MEKNIFIDKYLDLCGFACPINFVKCCLALENLTSHQILKVDLDIGEAETSVRDGLHEKGYKVRVLKKDSKKVTFIISSEEHKI